MRVMGIDPGPTPGIVLLDCDGGIVNIEVVQCSHALLYQLANTLAWEGSATLAIESFVVRGRATGDQSLTRDQVANLVHLFPGRVVLRSASQVKPWATDARLQAAVVHGEDTSLWLRTAGMRHARDAARHALYAAVHDGHLPDPLSKRSTP